MTRAIVLDAEGKELSGTSVEKAQKLLRNGEATLLQDDPLTIQLHYVVTLPPEPEPQAPEPLPGEGKRILLHICCGPCSTYTVQRLRELGFEVTGFWYNPNIHPFAEHEKRREAAREYAEYAAVPVLWHPGYDMPLYFREMAGHEAFGERCRRCYRLRLEQAAEVARAEEFDAFTTTLLISIHQDQDAIRAIGEEMGVRAGVPFFYEDLRRGYSERGRISNELGLYKQHYCGCLYSEWEAAQQRRAQAED